MAIEIIYRPMPSLNEGEKEILRKLTIDNLANGKRSLFKRWIDYYSNLGLLHTSIVYSNDEIVGWAAANMGDGWNCGLIGAFIQEEHRHNGYARLALETLLPRLKELYPSWPEYLFYMEEKKNLFAPVIEKYGFKDMVRNYGEYCEREREATSPKSPTA